MFPSGYLPGHRGCLKISDVLNRVEVAKFCPHTEDRFFKSFDLKILIHFSFGSHLDANWHTVQIPSSSKTDGRHKCIPRPMESDNMHNGTYGKLVWTLKNDNISNKN